MKIYAKLTEKNKTNYVISLLRLKRGGANGELYFMKYDNEIKKNTNHTVNIVLTEIRTEFHAFKYHP